MTDGTDDFTDDFDSLFPPTPTRDLGVFVSKEWVDTQQKVLLDRIEELEAALRQYADHENWVACIDEQSDKWVGNGGDGWEIAEEALGTEEKVDAE